MNGGTGICLHKALCDELVLLPRLRVEEMIAEKEMTDMREIQFDV